MFSCQSRATICSRPAEDVEQLWADEANYAEQLDQHGPRSGSSSTRPASEMGVGVTVMKCFGGGDLLERAPSPQAGVGAHRLNQCLGYALTRPGRDFGRELRLARGAKQLQECLAYEDGIRTRSKDYAAALASFPRISAGRATACTAATACPARSKSTSPTVTKFLNLTEGAKPAVPETVREHYAVLERHASDCIQCGACEKRCPFGVDIRKNMREAAKVFGK
jgi:predicted aldo/keto reductase-like oxidoreductase